MKALEKDRNRRYATANAFARDIQRYLADEPVEACPPSAGYRLHKFARKNRRVLATTGAFVLLLAAAALASTYQAIRATLAETTAASPSPGRRPTAKPQRSATNEEKLRSDQRLYVAEMGWAQQAWRESQLDQVREHLQGVVPARPEDADLRGFEWYYLRRLCDATPPTLLRHTGTIHGMAFSPDGRRIVSVSLNDGRIRIWDAGSGRLIRSQQTTAPLCVAYSPDGRTIATGGGGDNTVHIWDAASGALVVTLSGHTSHIVSVAFNPGEAWSRPPLRTTPSSSGMPRPVGKSALCAGTRN